MTNLNTEQKKSPSRKVFAAAALGLAGVAAATSGLVLNQTSASAEIKNAVSTSVKPYANAPSSFADLVEQVSPSVVSVFVKSKAETVKTQQKKRFNRGDRPPGFGRGQIPDNSPFKEFFEKRFGQQQQPKPQNSQGSGFIISEDGYVVTNHHVIKGGTEIKVTLSGGEQLDARLIGSDARTDLALLKIKDKRKFPAVPMAKEKARVGDWVLAVGNPFGLGGTVTAGIVSAHGRPVGQSPYDYLQIDAAVNRGNSGGPAFNLKGEVVGVNTAIYSPSGGNVGIAFAIPANVVQKIAKDLRKGGSVVRGWLGINIQNVSEDIAEGLSLDKPSGALVTRLVKGGPATKSDLKVRDVILSVNGVQIADVRDLMRQIGEIRPDEVIALEVLRNGTKKQVSVKLGTFPDGKKLAALQKGEPALELDNKALDDIGLSLAPARDLGKGKKGVVITEVDPDSDASVKGIKVGDVILEVNGKSVNFPADVTSEILKAKKTSAKVILVRVKDGPYYGLKLKKNKK
ncbi:MAG: Do family serine endopeptidase [Hyphomicrobiales bacterium]